MQLMVPAAFAALIAAVILSASAASVPAAVTLSTTATSVPAADTPSAQAGRQEPAISNVASPPGTSTLAGVGMAAARSGRVAPRQGFEWPLAPRPAVVRRFDPPQEQWSLGHRGVDLSAAVGQPVLSAGDGVVAFSGVVAGRGVIAVRHAGGLRTTYGAVDERLASGTFVHRGTRIGVVSPAPGHCGPFTCLHWGAIAGRADQQSYRDPLSLLGLGRPILLPLG